MAIAGRNETVHHLRLGYTDPDDLRTDLGQSLVDATESDWFPELRQTLEAYAAGERVSFTKFRYQLPGLTEFQQQVLRFVHRIPYGQVLSYGEVAAKVGCPGAARAVGTVMANNRLPLIIPCHRVIAAGGKLGGYSSPRGPGLKQWLLDLEQAGLPKQPR
jgi:methylated-DNA-[protein]-cysteine S-methyltransferase